MQAWESRIYAENDFDDTKASEEGEENVLHVCGIHNGKRAATSERASYQHDNAARRKEAALLFHSACLHERALRFLSPTRFCVFLRDGEREREPGLFGRLLGGYELVMIES